MATASIQATVDNMEMNKNKQNKAQNKRAKTLKSKLLRAASALQPRLTGRGDYAIKDIASAVARPFQHTERGTTIINKAARSLGEAVGSSIPGLGALGAGEYLGNAASWFSRLLGFGDYTIKRNSLLDVARRSQGRPASFNRKGADIIVRHEEYITDVLGSTDFNAVSYLLNPGNPALFPFLWQIASRYEEYEMLGVVFEYRPASYAYSANVSSGVVVMATDYDVLDSNYSDKRPMEASEYATSCMPSESMMHPIECDPRRNVMHRGFVKPGSTSLDEYGTGDPRLDFLGRTTVATQGMPETANGKSIGELWVSYQVRLSRPILEGALNVQSQKFTLTTLAPGSYSLDTPSHHGTYVAIDKYPELGAVSIKVTTRVAGTYSLRIEAVTIGPGHSPLATNDWAVPAAEGWKWLPIIPSSGGGQYSVITSAATTANPFAMLEGTYTTVKDNVTLPVVLPYFTEPGSLHFTVTAYPVQAPSLDTAITLHSLQEQLTELTSKLATKGPGDATIKPKFY